MNRHSYPYFCFILIGVLATPCVYAQTAEARAGSAIRFTGATAGDGGGTPLQPPPNDEDPDNDGLSNYEETQRGTDSLNPDTDGDGSSDGEDGWPRHSWISAIAPLPNVGYAVVRLGELGLDSTASAYQIDDASNVIASLDEDIVFWKADEGTVQTVPLLAEPNSSYGETSWQSMINLGRNGHVIGWIAAESPSLTGAGIWRAGESKATRLTPITAPGSPDWFPFAVNGNGHVVGIQYSSVWADPPDADSPIKEFRWGGVDYSAATWLGSTFKTDGNGIAYIPTAINDAGLVAAEKENSDGLGRTGILNGTSFSDLGPGIKNYYPSNRIDTLTSGTPVVALGLELQVYPNNKTWWAHKAGGAWVREDFTAWDPATQAEAGITNSFVEINDRLEIIATPQDPLSPSHIIRNGVIRSLTDLVSSDWSSPRARDINNHGVILGEATGPGTSAAAAVLMVPVALQVDVNRDGQLDNKDPLSTAAIPYRFWSNDDDDRSGKDHIESSKKDWADAEINSIRDLEDFARLNIYVGGLQGAVLNGSLKIGLKWKSTQSGAPSVKVWRNLSPIGGREYLFDETVANQHLTLGALGHIQGTTTYFIPLAFWQQSGFSATQPNGYLLFEGCTAGKGQLVMTINKPDGTEIGEGPGVWLDIKNIKSMYERAVATTGGPRSENGVDYTIPLPYSYVGPDLSNIAQPSMGWEPNPQGHPYQPDPAETKTYLIYIHGWRWSPAKASNRTETVFKRLWHLGYKGRLSALRWPTFYGGPDDGDDWMAGLSTYNDSEYRAWKSGESLKQYVNQLPSDYTRSVVAHSMGNIVTGSALRKGMAVVNYVLLNAAVPAMCYDESTSLHQWNYITPNNDPDSGTKGMAYTGKLKTLNPNVVNFFLTRDSATTFAWEANNHQFKPQNQIITSCVRGYYYARANPANMKFYVDFCVSPLRYLIDEDEVMSFACQSLTKTVGAEGRASGSIDSTVDMDAYSFGDEHGAEWDRNVMQTKAFYIQLMRSLQIPVQP
jgi:hypothetical protein